MSHPSSNLWLNIENRLLQLKRYEQDLKNPEVIRAIQVVHQVLDPHKHWFIRNQIVVTIHGSLLYHDPVNLDIDLSFLSEKTTFNSFIKKQTQLEMLFSEAGIWPRQPAVTDLYLVSLDDVKQELINTPNLSDMSEEELDDFYAAMDLAFYLNTKIIWSEQSRLFAKLMTQAKSIILTSPELCKLVISELDHYIQTRKERRLQ